MKFVPILGADMSGSLAGVTASRNRYGQYFREKVVPVNPNTTRQQAVRSYFATAINGWTALSAANRALWNDYAANTPFVDGLGNQKFVTGQNMYCRCNTLRAQIGEALVSAGPTTFNFGNPVTNLKPTTDGTPDGVIGVVASALSTSVDIMGGASADGDIAMYIGNPINPSRSFYKGPYQLAATSATTGASATEGFTGAPTIVTALAAGQYRSARFVIVYDDGRVSPAFEVLGVVTEDTP